MSTTVTYKGETLTTVDNATRVLQTAGKYCEDNFTLTDVSGGGGVTTAEVTIENNNFTNLYYTDANMTAHVLTSGNRDLYDEPLPVGSLVVLFREGMAEPSPFPMNVVGLTIIANYNVNSQGKLQIYEVTG